jgi:hypothetical protein
MRRKQQQHQGHIASIAIARRSLPGALARALALTLSSATALAAPPTLEYSQDGTHYQPLQVLASPQSADDYYNYFSHAAHPTFGVVKHTQTVCLYFDSTDGSLSLMFISGGGQGDHGSGRMTLTGLPRVAHLTLSDEPGEFHLSRKLDTLTGDFNYGDATDGFVVGDLEAATKNFTAKLDLISSHGIKDLRLTDGDPTSGGDFIPLDRDQPLYIRSLSIGHGHGHHPGAGGGVGSGNTGGNTGGGGNGGGVGSPVPEPSSLTAVMLAVAAFLKRSRRRRRPQRARP